MGAELTSIQFHRVKVLETPVEYNSLYTLALPSVYWKYISSPCPTICGNNVTFMCLPLQTYVCFYVRWIYFLNVDTSPSIQVHSVEDLRIPVAYNSLSTLAIPYVGRSSPSFMLICSDNLFLHLIISIQAHTISDSKTPVEYISLSTLPYHLSAYMFGKFNSGSYNFFSGARYTCGLYFTVIPLFHLSVYILLYNITSVECTLTLLSAASISVGRPWLGVLPECTTLHLAGSTADNNFQSREDSKVITTNLTSSTTALLPFSCQHIVRIGVGAHNSIKGHLNLAYLGPLLGVLFSASSLLGLEG
jgi:hypothetical protein